MIPILKSALSVLGIDLAKLSDQAAPTIVKELDKQLEHITLADGESKGIVIVPDNKGSYLVVKTVFDNEASQHMINKGHYKLDNLIKDILNSITK